MRLERALHREKAQCLREPGARRVQAAAGEHGGCVDCGRAAGERVWVSTGRSRASGPRHPVPGS